MEFMIALGTDPDVAAQIASPSCDLRPNLVSYAPSRKNWYDKSQDF